MSAKRAYPFNKQNVSEEYSDVQILTVQLFCVNVLSVGNGGRSLKLQLFVRTNIYKGGDGL